MSASAVSVVQREPQWLSNDAEAARHPHPSLPLKGEGMKGRGQIATPPVLRQREPVWLSDDDYNALRYRGRCPRCWKKVLHSYTTRLAPMPAVRRTLVLHAHFANVKPDGTVKDGGLELFFCPHCRIEYAYGPRAEGGYRLLRLS